MKKMRKRVVCEYEHFLDAQSAEIFTLLCPVREYEWIPQWRCDIIYTHSGVAELGCVFTTDYDDDFGKETWVVFSYVPSEKIAFVRTGKHRTTRYEVYLQPREKGTLIRWSQEITALDSRGDDLLAEFSQARFEAFMIPLNRMLAHYLATAKAMELSLES